MGDFDDEIIDLEDADDTLDIIDIPDTIEDSDMESPVSSPNNSIKKEVFDRTKNTLKNKFNKMDSTSQKLQNITSGQNNMPFLSNQKNEEKSGIEETIHKAKAKVAGEAITAATAGAIPEPVAEALAGKMLDEAEKRKKLIIKIVMIFFSLFMLILIGFMINFTGQDTDLGKNTIGYVTGDMSEEELINQLMYYGYCKSESSCKKKGIYKFYEKLKQVYEDANKACPSNLSNNSPCEVSIDTALILETINYYQNAVSGFDSYEQTEENKNILSSFMTGFVQMFLKKEKELNKDLSDVDSLVIAQSEYVHETCQYLTEEEKEEDIKRKNKEDEYDNYFYQISFDKYISYLKYGDSSTHPNYQGHPVEIKNEVCLGPQDDYITTNYSSNPDSSLNINSDTNQYTVTGAGRGVDIANYALQFVGNPYVYGGTDLIKGVDCSGFTMKVMEHFGITIPRTSSDQTNVGKNMGTDVNNALPGDLIVYYGHVAIYLGNNSIVHASSPKTGIKVSNNASYRKIKGIIRLWD